MTNKLFLEWLFRIDNQIKTQNCIVYKQFPSSKYYTNLSSNIKVKFLSLNITSKSLRNRNLCTKDSLARNYKNIKSLYRKDIVKKIISDIDDEKSTSIDILQDMWIVDKTYRNLTTITSVNYFRLYRFFLRAEEDDTLIVWYLSSKIPLRIEDDVL